MNIMESAVETKVEQLLAVLDEDIRHLKTTLSQLDMLRSLIIKRDDTALDRLLGEIRDGAETRAETERLRQTLREDLARTFGCDVGQMTLSQLRTCLSERQRAQVAERQATLKLLIEAMKREHRLTAVLVSDCARFNRSLMQAFFGANGQRSTTYSPNGSAMHRTNATLMSMQL